MKTHANANKPLLSYNFWRSYSGAEVDYIEKPISGDMRAYEFKYTSSVVSRGAHSFTDEYKTSVTLINTDSYLDFITTPTIQEI